MRPFLERFPYFLSRAVTRPTAAFKVIRQHAPALDVLLLAAIAGVSLIVSTLVGAAPALFGHRIGLREIGARLAWSWVFYLGSLAFAIAYAFTLAPLSGLFTGKARAFRTALATILSAALTAGVASWCVAGLVLVEGGSLTPESLPLAYLLYGGTGLVLVVLGVEEIHELDMPRALGLALLAFLPILLIAAVFSVFFIR